jgi:hypothetical protein
VDPEGSWFMVFFSWQKGDLDTLRKIEMTWVYQITEHRSSHFLDSVKAKRTYTFVTVLYTGSLQMLPNL